MIALSTGKTLSARPVAAGNQKYFAFAVGNGVRALRWTAYDNSLRVIATDRMR